MIRHTELLMVNGIIFSLLRLTVFHPPIYSIPSVWKSACGARYNCYYRDYAGLDFRFNYEIDQRSHGYYYGRLWDLYIWLSKVHLLLSWCSGAKF